MNCPNCGNEVKSDMPFCTSCGQKLENLGAPNPQDVNAEKQANFEKTSSFDDGIDRFFSKFPLGGSKLSANAPKIAPQNVTLLTNSMDIDKSGANKVFTSHRYASLGGFLAFVVYFGIFLVFVGIIWILVGAGMKIGDMLPYLTYGTPVGIPIVIFSIIDILWYVFFMAISLLLFFRLLKKIKNREVDFLQYFHKTMFWFTVMYAISLILGFILGSFQYGGFTYYMNSQLGKDILGFFGVIIALIASTFLLSAYCVSSQRLRTYMGTDLYFQVCPFTRNSTAPIPAGGKTEMNKTNASSDTIANQGPRVTTYAAPAPAQNAQPATKFCKQCGAKIKASSDFCTKCGAKL